MSKKETFFKIFFVAIFSMAAVFSFGQRWLTHRYTGLNGLPSSNTYHVVQDHTGRMWFATRAGIACCDGVSWQKYTVSEGLPVQAFVEITADRQGRIWSLADSGKGVIYVVFYDGNRWNLITPPDKPLRRKVDFSSFQVLSVPQPIVMVGTGGAGIYRWEQGKWTNLTTADGLAGDVVNGIVLLNEKFYAATDNGLSVINRDGTINNRWNRQLDLPSPGIKGICIEHKDKYPDFPLKHSRLWLYGHHWLVCLEQTAQGLKKGNVYDLEKIVFGSEHAHVELLPDYRSGLYVGKRYELYYFNYNARRLERVSVLNGMVGEGTNGMFIDFEKNVWVACDRGVTRISGRQFTGLQMAHGLLEDEVTAVLEYEPGKFVLGHNNGFTFYNYQTGVSRKLAVIPPPRAATSVCRVLDMKVDSKKNIWAALGRTGLVRIDQQKKVRRSGKQDDMPGDVENVMSVWVEPGDTVWLGTDQGLMRRSGERFIRVPVGNFNRFEIRRLFGDPPPSLRLRYIAGVNSGVYVYNENNKQWKNYREPGEGNSKNVYAVLKDSKNRLLVGTLAGLFIAAGETLKKFAEKGFEINRPVYFLVEDAKQRLWVGTDSGVFRWDGSRVIHYSVAQGLIGQETNRAAGMVDSTGKLWIGTNRGVSVYNEAFDNYSGRVPPPKLSLLYLAAENQKFPLDRPVQLSSEARTLVFHARAISFLDEQALRFRDKLTGFSNQWSEEHYPYQQAIRYSSLNPGKYRFHLKVKNALGVWSETVTSAEIVILKPFYKQWWFMLVLALAVVFIIYAILRFVSARRITVLLEKQVKERTDQLDASEKRYRALFEESQDLVFVSTKEGKLADINPAGVALLGCASREEALNMNILSEFYFSEAKREAIRKEIEEKGFVKEFEMNFRRKNGEKITVLVTASPVPGEKGQFLALRGIARDITEKKKLQEQLEQAQKMEAIGTLAGGIAHDFNNILGVIIGYLELTLDDLPEGTQVYHNIEQVRTAADRARELVNQILTFSRRTTRKRKPLRISIIIKEALKLLRSSLPATIEIRQNISAEAGIVLADATQVQQVVMNLCTNAAHAMREKGGVMEVALREVFLDETSAAAYGGIKPGVYLMLTVSDTGHGIEPEVIKRIFEPYFTTKKTGEGTGMGLAVLHGIVKSYGGEVTVYSEPGIGTTFHVLLPAVEGSVDAHAMEAEDIPKGKNQHILFVDDEILLADVAEKVLEKLGYRVTTRTGSPEALETFRSGPHDFDLVITDLTMPNMTGIQLFKELKQIRPDIPIILSTGFSDSITTAQLKDLGFHSMLMKPITRINLARAIGDALEKKKLRS